MPPRRTSILAVTLVLVAVPARALAVRGAAHVRPRAFASCAHLVGYERTHFAVTHGVPETSPRPLSEPSIVAPSPSGSTSPQAAAPVESAGTTVSGTSMHRNPTRRHHGRGRLHARLDHHDRLQRTRKKSPVAPPRFVRVPSAPRSN